VRRPAAQRVDRGEAGTASLVLPMLVWVVTLAAIALVDVTAYLVAAARGQALADATALAAVSAHAPAAVGTAAARPAGDSPLDRARTVAAAGGGILERCDCVGGSARAVAVVSVPVPGLVLPRLGAGRIEAEAAAVLAPPEDVAARTRPYPALQPAAAPVVEVGDTTWP
jgi:hypothetical protein